MQIAEPNLGLLVVIGHDVGIRRLVEILEPGDYRHIATEEMALECLEPRPQAFGVDL